MKVFICSNDEYWSYGGFDHLQLLVVSETAQTALGACLEAYPDKPTHNWDIEEVDTDTYSVQHLSSSCS